MQNQPITNCPEFDARIHALAKALTALRGSDEEGCLDLAIRTAALDPEALIRVMGLLTKFGVFCGRAAETHRVLSALEDALVLDPRAQREVDPSLGTLWALAEHTRALHTRPQRSDLLSSSNVYFLQRPDGAVKIGHAQNVEKRRDALQKSAGVQLVILATLPGVGQKIEAEYHQRFKHLRMEGEWFSPGQELMDAIAALT